MAGDRKLDDVMCAPMWRVGATCRSRETHIVNSDKVTAIFSA